MTNAIVIDAHHLFFVVLLNSDLDFLSSVGHQHAVVVELRVHVYVRNLVA
jgi:hypothetical protein